MDRKVRTGSIPVSSTNLKIIYLYQMKKVFFIAALIMLASCSNETSTSHTDTLKCADSTCSDSMSVDSLAHQVELRSDSVLTGVKELAK